MSMTLTAILPTIHAGLNIISREMIGIIPAMQRNSALEGVAVGQQVTVPVVGAASTGNVTPGATPPAAGNSTIGAKSIAITKSVFAEFTWNGEEQMVAGATGQYNRILADQFAQGMRTLANLIEVDATLAAARSASRAYGTAGVTPFGIAGDLTDFAGINQILDDNGAPQFDRRFIAGSGARFNLEGKQSILFKANEAGSDAFLRRRVVGDVMNLGIGISAQAPFMTKGTGAGYLVNNGAGYPVGGTAIEVDTGTGTILAGDIVTFAGDANKYVAAGLSGTTLTINGPGLRQAVADNAAISIGNSYRANVAFTPDALVLAARPPATPMVNGQKMDMAEDRTIVQDPTSGLPFEIAVYRQYMQVRFEVRMAWGIGVVSPRHVASLLG